MCANVNWDNLIDEHALALLLPDDYPHFARPVKESLVVFLSGLPESIQATILAEQAALPLSATVSERLGMLASSCPVLHKLGQVLARDGRLAPELRRQLRRLESMPPTVPLHVIEAILSQELGSLEARGIMLMPPAIAEASVAVVIPFHRKRDSNLPYGGVFKILKPGSKSGLLSNWIFWGGLDRILMNDAWSYGCPSSTIDRRSNKFVTSCRARCSSTGNNDS